MCPPKSPIMHAVLVIIASLGSTSESHSLGATSSVATQMRKVKAASVISVVIKKLVSV
jgi:hypothetical protein